MYESMGTWFNFLLGRKNSSTTYVNYGGDASSGVDEVVDENGFVIVKSEDRQQQRCTQVLSTPFFFHYKHHLTSPPQLNPCTSVDEDMK